jgi:hypothetical protein
VNRTDWWEYLWQREKQSYAVGVVEVAVVEVAEAVEVVEDEAAFQKSCEDD